MYMMDSIMKGPYVQVIQVMLWEATQDIQIVADTEIDSTYVLSSLQTCPQGQRLVKGNPKPLQICGQTLKDQSVSGQIFQHQSGCRLVALLLMPLLLLLLLVMCASLVAKNKVVWPHGADTNSSYT
jgi:hypothetical protein